jgi:hypothetical protein
MKYYKQLNDKGEVISLGQIEGDSILPEDTTEISQSDYEAAQAALREADEKAAEEQKAKAEAEAEAAEKAKQEHEAVVKDYVDKVKAGTVKLTDVPDDYKAEVDAIINPPVIPPTNSELNDRLAAAEGAIDFLTMVAGTDATGDNTTASDATTTADSNSTATK